jgi:hypothetical protein
VNSPNETLVDELMMPVVIDDEEVSEEELRQDFILLSENAIPIPPSMSTIVDERYEKARKAKEDIVEDWKESYTKYQYEGSHQDTRDANSVAKENMVRQNVSTLTSLGYMRNPTAELTTDDEEKKPLVSMLRDAAKSLVTKKQRPGINLKPKVNKATAVAHLTNFAVAKIEYQGMQGSLENVTQVYKKIEEKLQTEENPDRAKEQYELLDRAYKQLQISSTRGVTLSIRSPFNIFPDPKCTEHDLSDADFWFERIPMDLAFIKSEYTVEITEEDEDGKTSTQRYYKYDQAKPFDLEETSQRNEAANAKDVLMDELFPEFSENTRQELSKDTITCVEYYDRKARKKYLYIEDHWDCPLWVWEDELKLSRFFPYFVLSFAPALGSISQPGEVSFYAHMQDGLNEINHQAAWVRSVAFRNWYYDSQAIDSDQVDKIKKTLTESTSEIAMTPIKLRGEKSLEDILMPLKLPSTQFAEIFDKGPYLESINRASRVSDAMRGEQFKTNTTNDAVETYNNFTSTLMDSITDRVESFVEEIIWAILEIMVSKFDKEQMSQLVSADKLDHFDNMSVEVFNNTVSMEIVAGSSQRPTSAVKKREAREIVQGLGQFGKVAPRSVLSIVFRVIKDAFSRTYITDKDIENLNQEAAQGMEAQQQKAQQAATMQGAQAQATPPQ